MIAGIAVIVNLGVLVFLIIVAITAIKEAPSGVDWRIIGLCFVYVGFNLIALCLPYNPSWLVLYLKRKRLEEKKKIEALEKGGEK